MSEPVTVPHPGPTPSGRKSPVTIPWRLVARRLAEGEKPGAIAAGLGLEEDRIWRHLRRSLRFRFYLRQALERQQMLAGLQLGTAGRSAMLSRGLQPESLDGDLLRLLNEAAVADVAPAGDLAGRIERLGETGQRPPNMAFRARIMAERRVMDAAVAEARDFLAAVTQAPAANPSEPEPTRTNRNEPERTSTDLNEPERTVTNPNGPERAQGAPPARPARPPASRVTHPPAIVDLDGPDLARLRASGALSPGPSGD